jgi:hypothetical protein
MVTYKTQKGEKEHVKEVIMLKYTLDTDPINYMEYNKFVVEKGDLELLKVLIAHGCPFDKSIPVTKQLILVILNA